MILTTLYNLVRRNAKKYQKISSCKLCCVIFLYILTKLYVRLKNYVGYGISK